MSIPIFFLYQLNRCCVQYAFLYRAKHLSLNYSSARWAENWTAASAFNWLHILLQLPDIVTKSYFQMLSLFI